MKRNLDPGLSEIWTLLESKKGPDWLWEGQDLGPRGQLREQGSDRGTQAAPEEH